MKPRKWSSEKQEVIWTEKCTGCRSCEIACSYHHRRVFSRKFANRACGLIYSSDIC
ncbi:MAG: 4Fe-4S binding protein [Deltaproteobacteria bacterium]|nr:MAG: 4Fe-4S binding protein [Deltaproteobacteria bacterium]